MESSRAGLGVGDLFRPALRLRDLFFREAKLSQSRSAHPARLQSKPSAAEPPLAPIEIRRGLSTTSSSRACGLFPR